MYSIAMIKLVSNRTSFEARESTLQKPKLGETDKMALGVSTRAVRLAAGKKHDALQSAQSSGSQVWHEAKRYQYQ